MKQEILKLALDMLNVPSISGEEQACALKLCQQLLALGFIIEKIPVDEKRFNIFAYLKPHARFAVIYCTHIDTVAPFIAPHFDEKDQILWGRGSLDAKGIASAMICSVLKQREEGFDDLALLFTVGEEEASDGAKACSHLKGRAKFLVIGEPTDLKAASFQKGTLVFDIEATGQEAHSSMPHLGNSAIHKLIGYLNRLINYPWPKDPHAGETLINIGIIDGGDMRNMLAKQALAQGIMRLARPASEILPILNQEKPLGLALKIKSVADPFSYVVPAGFESFIAGFGSDAPYLRDMGQCILLGPGSIELAHKENEHVLLEDLFLGALAYEKIAQYARRC